jgi:hypothetical protein
VLTEHGSDLLPTVQPAQPDLSARHEDETPLRITFQTLTRLVALLRWARMTSTESLAPKTRRWTRVEYERLVECGVFQPGERLELLDGLLVVREPQSSRHATGIRRVIAELRRALGDTWQIDRLQGGSLRARRHS